MGTGKARQAGRLARPMAPLACAALLLLLTLATAQGRYLKYRMGRAILPASAHVLSLDSWAASQQLLLRPTSQ